MTALSAATVLTQWASLSHSVNKVVSVIYGHAGLRAAPRGMLMGFGRGAELSGRRSTSAEKKNKTKNPTTLLSLGDDQLKSEEQVKKTTCTYI